MKKKVLIVGANGFIGKNLFLFLSDRDDLDLYAPNRLELNLLDADACELYLKKIKPDVIIHSAVNINSTEDSLKIFFNIFNHKDSYGRLIQIGSGAEYDKRVPSPLVGEDAFGRIVPVDSYGLSKYLISREMEAEKNPQKFTNIRVFGIYGPYEDGSRRFISNNILRVMAGLGISINKDMAFDYIYVDDLVKLIAKFIDGFGLKETSYNFCSGSPVLLSNLATIITELMSYRGEIRIKNSGLNIEYSGNPQKIISEMGGFRFTDHHEGILKLINFYKSPGSTELVEKYRRLMNE